MPSRRLQFNADLIDDLARRRVVLFLGSGVSASAKTRAGRPIRQWRDFLLHAAKELDPQARKGAVDLIKSNEFLLASEIISAALQTRWKTLLEEEFAQVGKPSRLHKALIRLKQRIVITTNFDKILENAWNDGTVDDTHYPELITKLDRDIFRILRDNKSYIIKLHGTIDDADGLVFTKSSYAQRAYGDWVYQEFINTLLLTHTFVFIGFSMSDPAISLLVEMNANKYASSRPHYIFLADTVSDSIRDVYKRLRRIFIISYSSKDHHKELAEMVEGLGRQSQAREREILATAKAVR